MLDHTSCRWTAVRKRQNPFLYYLYILDNDHLTHKNTDGVLFHDMSDECSSVQCRLVALESDGSTYTQVDDSNFNVKNDKDAQWHSYWLVGEADGQGRG